MTMKGDTNGMSSLSLGILGKERESMHIKEVFLRVDQTVAEIAEKKPS